MALDLVMPKLGLTMTEGAIQSWLVTPGAAFSAGHVLFVVETEKIASEVEATADGVLDEILAPAGETVPCGAAIARWTPAATRTLSTPFARKLARELDVDLTQVPGSGPRGRIKAPDVRRAASAASERSQVSAPRADQRRQATAFERTSAERLTRAKQAPHFYLSSEVEISRLEGVRAELNAQGGSPRISMTHLLLAALARTVADVPTANQVWDEGEVVRFPRVDLGLAVSTERGLVAPVLRDVGNLRLHELVARSEALILRARAGTLGADDMGGGATGLSNAGMHDVTHMSSIIAPGHSSIFGIGSVRELFRPGPDRQPRLARELGIVMSADHRIFDGVSALAVLSRFKFYLEHPLHILS